MWIVGETEEEGGGGNGGLKMEQVGIVKWHIVHVENSYWPVGDADVECLLPPSQNISKNESKKLDVFG